MPQRVLALEIEPAELKAALLETSYRDYKLLGFFREPRDHAIALGDQLRTFIDKNQLGSSVVLTALPGDQVTLRTFFLPFRDRKRLDQTVPFELETQVPFGLDEGIVSYHVLHRDKSGSSVLAAMVQRGHLEKLLATMTEAGLDPKVIDLAPVAALNVLQLLGPDCPETFVYLGGTPGHTEVALYRNRQLVGVRTIVPLAHKNGSDPEAAVAHNGSDTVHADQIVDLVRDIRWTLMALNGAPLDDDMPCIIAGDGPHFAALGQQLHDGLGLVVRRLEQAPMKTISAELRAEMAPFVGPLGLALREVNNPDTLGLNFRQGEFAYHRGAEEVRRKLWFTGGLGVLALTLFITSAFMRYQLVSNRLELVNREIRKVFTATLPDIKRVNDERRQMQDEITSAEKRLKLLRSVAPPSGTTAIDALRTLSTAIPDSLRLEVDEYVMDTEDIKMKARTDTLETPNAIREAILAAKYFDEVQVRDIKSAQDGKVDFRIIVTLKSNSGQKVQQAR